MSLYPEDYIEYVINDLKNNGAARKVKKAGLIERCTVKSCDPEKMYPNPEDEFSNENIGPNFEIIGDYAKEIRNCLAHGLPIFEEPVLVEKLTTEGYLILNGHHRWFAALRMKVKKIIIHIVNLTHEEDLVRMISNTSNDKRVAFDLDEVLLATDADDQEPIIDNLFAKRFKERLRVGTKELFTAFKDNGYDVWVYTAGYNTEEYINHFFSMYEISPDGVVNGINNKIHRNADEIDRIKNMLKTKYKLALHIDNESIVCIDTESKKFDQYDLPGGRKDWAESIISILPTITENEDANS